MARQVQLLPTEYGGLAKALAHLVSPNRVFITEYPNLLTSDSGALCGTRTILLLNEREIVWLHDFFFLPLNRAIARARKKWHWHLITGPAAAFVGHAYCASDTNRWIVQYNESEHQQGNTNGTLHPNLTGQTKIADFLYPILQRFLIATPAPKPEPTAASRTAPPCNQGASSAVGL